MWLLKDSGVERSSVGCAVMKLIVTAQKCMYLWCFLSTAVFHSVSAGGAYCAETARARAAALGLAYPGVHGAPDLSAPAPHELQHPRMFSYGASAEPNMDRRIFDQPGTNPFLDLLCKQIHSMGFDGFLPSRGSFVPHGYSGFPRALPVRTPESSFEGVKHDAPSILTLNPRSSARSLPFVYNVHNLGVDESGPNRHGVSLSGLPMPRAWGRPNKKQQQQQQQADKKQQAEKKAQAKKGPVRKFPFFHASGPASKANEKKKAPVHGRWKLIWIPIQLGQHLPKLLNSQHFLPGKTVLQTRPDYICDPSNELCSAQMMEGVPLMEGVPMMEGVPLMEGVPMMRGVPLVMVNRQAFS